MVDEEDLDDKGNERKKKARWRKVREKRETGCGEKAMVKE